jgi:transcriptional regulator with XRE-family HTH domain
MDIKAIGNNIKELRTTNTDLSAPQAAQQLNITRDMYYKIEAGKTMLRLDKLLLLCKIYHCTPNNILKDLY